MVDDSERRGLEALIRVAWNYETTARALLDMEWVADGLSSTEADFISELSYVITYVSAETVESALAWVADGVSGAESDAIDSLKYIAFTDEDAALRVMAMPFLQTLEGADAAALHFLSALTADQLADMLSRPMLKDGITDDEAPIVSMLDIVLHYVPDRVDRLLDPDATTVERRTVELPLAGEVDLVIVRTRPGARRSMDLLENAVREVESLMGEPLPTRYVGLLVENALPARFAGLHAGSHIVIRPKFDVDNYGSYPGFPPYLIAHEVAHYYWRGSADWINEGMANTMAATIENRRVGSPLYTLTDVDCRFAALLRTLGEDAFWDGARNLYNASGGANINIEAIRHAFGADADNVIARWRGIPQLWC